jgi:hypothetical protein
MDGAGSRHGRNKCIQNEAGTKKIERPYETEETSLK